MLQRLRQKIYRFVLARTEVNIRPLRVRNRDSYKAVTVKLSLGPVLNPCLWAVTALWGDSEVAHALLGAVTPMASTAEVEFTLWRGGDC